MSAEIDDGLNDRQMGIRNKLSSIRYRASPPRKINVLLIIIVVTPSLFVRPGRFLLFSGTVRAI